MKVKKILAVVVALALCMSALSMVASAAASTIASDSPAVPTLADPIYGNPYMLPNYTPFIDFTDWTAADLDASELKNTGAAYSVDASGLLVLTAESAVGGFCNVVKVPDCTAPGAVNSITENGLAAPADSTTDGLCFYVDATEWESPKTATGTESIRFLMNDTDYTEEGEIRKKAGEPQNSTWCFTAEFPAGFKGWVKVPFADHELFWGAEDANGYVDLANIGNFWFYLDGSGINEGTTLKIGKFGFYGVNFGAEKVLASDSVEAPADFLPNYKSLIDYAPWTDLVKDPDGPCDEFYQTSEGNNWAVSIDDNGLFTVKSEGKESWGCKVMWLQDDDCNPLPGVTPVGTKGNLVDTTTTENGFCMYLDATNFTTNNSAGIETITFILRDTDYKEDGTQVMDKGVGATVHFVFSVSVPAGFKGWVKVPFAEANKEFWQYSDVNGKIDLSDVKAFWFNCNGFNFAAGSELKFGKIGVYGPAFAPAEEKPEDKPGEKNPDSGVNAATGIASGLAIAALAVAAAAALRKKND